MRSSLVIVMLCCALLLPLAGCQKAGNRAGHPHVPAVVPAQRSKPAQMEEIELPRVITEGKGDHKKVAAPGSE